MGCVIVDAWENHRAKAATLFFGGVTLQTEEEGGDNNDYISGFFLVLYICCRPYQSALSDF